MTLRLRTYVRRLLPVLFAGSATAPALLWAHTALRRSAPAAGANLIVAPTRLVLEFTEVVALPTARVVLFGAAGDTVALSGLQHADSTRRVLVAELIGPPRAGRYTVEWTVAGTDGHPVRGTFGFAIDSAASGIAAAGERVVPPPDAGAGMQERPWGDPGTPLDASSPVYVVARFLGLVAMLGLLGAVVAGRLVVPRVWPDSGERKRPLEGVRRIGLLSAGALIASAAARLLLQSVAIRGAWDPAAAWYLVTGTIWGTGWLLQAGGALLSAISLGVQRLNPFGPAVMLAGVLIAVAAPLAGHPVSVPGAAPLAVGLDAVHVLAAGSWIGGLAVLLFAVVPAATGMSGGAGWDAVRRVFIAFTPVALASAAALVLSGAAGAWLQLGGIEPILSSTYGRLLLVKVAIVLVVAILGLLNWRRLVPGIDSPQGLGRLRASAGTELALGVVALLVTAVLAATTPPGGGLP